MSKEQDYKRLMTYFGNYSEPWQRHCRLVAYIASKIAKNITDCNVELAFFYGLVHDIGKFTERSKEDPRYHCVDGFLILQNLGFDELKMSALSHSFPNLRDLSLVPGYYNPLWDPDVKDKSGIEIKGIWDTFIPEKLDGYEGNIYDKIVNLSDLMSAGDRVVTISKRLEYVYRKYGTSPKDSQTILEIRKNVRLIEELAGKKLDDMVGDI